MLPLLLNRRNLLRFLSGTAAVTFLGCVREPSASADIDQSSTPATTGATTPLADRPACLVRPQQTEGPYFVEEGLNRSDIRTDPADGAIKQGIPLQLTFRISQVSNDACVPLSGAIVDLWHCDALGVYSDVADPRFSTVGQKFLRGYQVTNADGTAEFLTIYPGWYPGRTVHIHFKIRSSAAAQQSYEFTSQLYFDDNLTDQVHAQAPYSSKGPRNTRNNNDGIFQNGGEQLLLQLGKTAEGYETTFNIGLEMV